MDIDCYRMADGPWYCEHLWLLGPDRLPERFGLPHGLFLLTCQVRVSKFCALLPFLPSFCFLLLTKLKLSRQPSLKCLMSSRPLWCPPRPEHVRENAKHDAIQHREVSQIVFQKICKADSRRECQIKCRSACRTECRENAHSLPCRTECLTASQVESKRVGWGEAVIFFLLAL